MSLAWSGAVHQSWHLPFWQRRILEIVNGKAQGRLSRFEFMRTLWTPWRMEHVRQALPRPAGCLFDLPEDAVQDPRPCVFCGLSVVLSPFPYAMASVWPGVRWPVSEGPGPGQSKTGS